MLASSLMLNFFDGKRVPEKDRSFDGVSFMGVLHHAANNTPSLLHEAGRVARRWIVVCEDLNVGSNAARNKKHDPRGIFRTHDQWVALFAMHLPEFDLVGSSFAARREGVTTSKGLKINLRTKGTSPWVYGYALRRKGVGSGATTSKRKPQANGASTASKLSHAARKGLKEHGIVLDDGSSDPKMPPGFGGG